MVKKTIMLVTVLAMLVSGGLALAETGTPATDRPYGRQGRGFNPMMKFNQDKEVQALHTNIRNKTQDLLKLFTAPTVDEAQARGLHREVSELRSRLAEKRFDYLLSFKKDNPDWQPRFSSQGRGDRGRPHRGGGPRGSQGGGQAWSD